MYTSARRSVAAGWQEFERTNFTKVVVCVSLNEGAQGWEFLGGLLFDFVDCDVWMVRTKNLFTQQRRRHTTPSMSHFNQIERKEPDEGKKGRPINNWKYVYFYCVYFYCERVFISSNGNTHTYVANNSPFYHNRLHLAY